MSRPNTKLQQQQKASAQAQLSLSLSFEIPKSQFQSIPNFPDTDFQSIPMAASSSREENVYVAKLAEQAKRYEEMVEFMEKVVSSLPEGEEPTVEERNRLFQ
ncbi:hypothetical protein TB1_003665 [Malus domestica]